MLCAMAFAPAIAADRWWDGTNTGGTGDGASAGGTATWDLSTLNWDQGGVLSRVAWSNANNDSANFGGTAGTVTLGTGITANGLIFTSSNYALSSSTLTLGGTAPRLFNSGTVTINSALAGTAGLAKSGNGTLTIRGSATHGLTGGLTVNGGIAELDFVNFTTPTDLIGSGNSATLGGGTFRVKGKSTGTSSQTISGVTLNGGTSGISVVSNGGTGNLTLGAITRNAGGTVNFTLPAGGDHHEQQH